MVLERKSVLQCSLQKATPKQVGVSNYDSTSNISWCVILYSYDPYLPKKMLPFKARAAGAELVGSEDLIADILKGVIDFDRCVATPEMMPKLGRVARVSSLVD
jgi:hypothetical protein